MKRFMLEDDLVADITEIAPPTLEWQGMALMFIRGSIAEFWMNASNGSGLRMNVYRERVRAFMREGDTLSQALTKARSKEHNK